jgi:hypothetical protein
MLDVLKFFKRGDQVPARWEAFDRAVGLAGGMNVNVAEVGVSGHFTNGLSTVYWSKDDRVASVTAIDIKKSEIDTLTRKVGELSKVTYMVGYSVNILASLPNWSLDLLYLDGDVSPWLTVHEYMAAASKLKPGAIVLVDDYGAKAPLLHKLVMGEKIPFGYHHYGSWSMEPSPLVHVLELEGAKLLLFRHACSPVIKATD